MHLHQNHRRMPHRMLDANFLIPSMLQGGLLGNSSQAGRYKMATELRQKASPTHSDGDATWLPSAVSGFRVVLPAPLSSPLIRALFLCAQTCLLLWCWLRCCSTPQGPRLARPPRAPQGRPQGRRRRPGAPMTRWRWPLNLFSGPPNSIKMR